MANIAYRLKLSCGHALIGVKKLKVGTVLNCPIDGDVQVMEIEKGSVEAYNGFVPS